MSNSSQPEELYKDKADRLQLLENILASNAMGTWHHYVPEEGMPQLQPDDTMKDLMGIPAGSAMTAEEIWQMLVSRVHPSDRKIFDNFNARLRQGERVETTYRWYHPTLGVRYVRCGGVVVTFEGEMAHFNGYHFDVTEQMMKDIRSNSIIKMLANTYIFINYIDLDEDTFVTYSGREEIESDAVIKMLMSSSTSQAINVGLDEIVRDDYKVRMREFMDFSTIDERMEKTNLLVTEFVDYRNLWYESTLVLAERRKKDGTVKNLLWTVRSTESEKQIELRRQKILDDNIAANAAKTKFLQNMSHEIRTPLNALFGFAQLLGLPDGSCTPEEKEQYNAYIYNSYRMLEMLVGDIIDIADSENGNYRIEISDVGLNKVCNSALMSVEFRVPAAVKMYMTSDYPDDYTVKSDERRIQQVLINYLTNACKNTQKGEIHLHISKTEHPGKVTFSVSDTGRGVPPEKAEAIFTRFTKLNQFVQGSGLGLSICQMIAEKLNAEVYLDTAYTDGARFVFAIEDTGSAE